MHLCFNSQTSRGGDTTAFPRSPWQDCVKCILWKLGLRLHFYLVSNLCEQAAHLSHSVPREARLGTGNPLPLDRLLHICSAVVLCLHLPGAPDLPLVHRMNSWQKYHDPPFWYWAPDSKDWRFPNLEEKHTGEESSRIRAQSRVRGQSLSLVVCIFTLNHQINHQSKIQERFWEVRSVE